MKELEERPKLCKKEIVAIEFESGCVVLKRKRVRRIIIKLRGGTAAFPIEMGRWQGVERNKRTCKECQSEEVEDVCHWLLQCPACGYLRLPWWKTSVNGLVSKDRVSASRQHLFQPQHAPIVFF